MVTQGIVKSRSSSPDLGQFIPRHRRKIMVLIVVTHIKGNGVQGAIITMGFLVTICQIMLLNPASTQWMQTHRKKKEAIKNTMDLGPRK